MDKHLFYSNKLWTTELELELEPEPPSSLSWLYIAQR